MVCTPACPLSPAQLLCRCPRDAELQGSDQQVALAMPEAQAFGPAGPPHG